MTQQLELTPAPRSTPDVAWLEQTLLRADRWLTARELVALAEGRFDDRDIRALASESYDVVSGPRGYRHLSHCDLAEIERGCDRLESQAREMTRRSLRLRRHAHQVLH